MANLKQLLKLNQLKVEITLPKYLKFFMCVILLLLIDVNNIYAQDAIHWEHQFKEGSAREKLEASWELFKYYRTTNRDSAVHYAKYNNQVAVELRDTLSLVKSLNALGYLKKENGDYLNAIIEYERGLQLAKIQNYSDQIKFLMNNLALAHTYYGNYDKSLDYHFQSLRIREQEKDLKGIAVAYNNIGLVYYQIDDNEKALNYYLKSLEIRRENLITEGIENCLINLGLVYSSLDRHEEALSAYNEIFEICGDNCDKRVALDASVGSGFAYFTIGKYNEAKKRFLRGKELSDDLENKINLVVTNYYLAKINFEEDSIVKAFDYLDEASKVTSSTDAQTWRMEIDNLYAEMYQTKGEFERAYYHKNRYSALRDSIFNEDLIKNLANIQLDFQEAQSQEIIADKDFQIKRRNQINLMLGGITLLITALLIILYKNIQLKKKANRQLAEANDIIEHQNKELTDVNAVLEERVKERTKELKTSNEALIKSNEELDNFIYKTSHDIRGPLATLMGVCNIAQIDVKDQQALDYFDKLSITAIRLNEILSKLLIINQINNTAVQSERIDFDSLINELIDEQKSNYKDSKVKISIDVAHNANLTTDLELLHVIYGNLINNAFKFRDTSDRKESSINLSLTQNGKWVKFKITDNGMGINTTESEKIFEVFSKASDIADSSGIGLYLVKLAVEKLQGQIIHGKTEQGETFFEVRLPA